MTINLITPFLVLLKCIILFLCYTTFNNNNNICYSNAKNCNAFSHCVQTIWEKHTVPEDNDSICKICLDMVEQARDQLNSNETQEEIKEVFEGSCALIPIKVIRHECDDMVDNFIPELVEALSSQMNPQV